MAFLFQVVRELIEIQIWMRSACTVGILSYLLVRTAVAQCYHVKLLNKMRMKLHANYFQGHSYCLYFSGKRHLSLGSDKVHYKHQPSICLHLFLSAKKKNTSHLQLLVMKLHNTDCCVMISLN